MLQLRKLNVAHFINRCLHITKDQNGTKFVPPATLGLDAYGANKIKMCGWQIHNYGDVDELQLSDKLKVPQIRKANECLVKVLCSSVNPIDVAMLGGYGAEVLNILRCQPKAIEFPLTLGREFCGILVQRGMNISDSELPLRERVWGVVPFQTSKGAHAQYVVVPDYCVSRAPKSLSDEEAAAVLYAGLTAWSGLYITAALGGICGVFNVNNITTTDMANIRVLILGGSGSVGSMAIQILKAQNAQVVATCSDDAVKLVKYFGADHVIDYRNTEQMSTLKLYAPYDVILDCSGQGPSFIDCLKDVIYNQYVTFSSPLLRNIDSSGLGFGLLKNAMNLLETNVKSIANRNGLVKWGFFVPNSQGIQQLKQLAEHKKLMPQIEKVYQFDELPEAFKRVQDGHLRGKVIIKV